MYCFLRTFFFFCFDVRRPGIVNTGKVCLACKYSTYLLLLQEKQGVFQELFSLPPVLKVTFWIRLCSGCVYVFSFTTKKIMFSTECVLHPKQLPPHNPPPPIFTICILHYSCYLEPAGKILARGMLVILFHLMPACYTYFYVLIHRNCN